MRAVLLLLCLLLSPLPGLAQDAAAPDKAEAARLLADVLDDPAARDALVAQLRLAAEGTPVEQPSPAPTILDTTIVQVLAKKTTELANTVWTTMVRVGETITDFNGIRASFAAVDWPRIAQDALAVGTVLLVTLGAMALLRRITQPLRRRLSLRLAGTTWWGKLLGLCAIAAFDLCLIALSWSSGFFAAIATGTGGGIDLRQSLFLNAFLVVECATLALRLILSPSLPALRFWPMEDETAREWHKTPSRIIALLGYGMLVLVPLARASLSPGLTATLQLLLLLVAGQRAIALILRNRVKVRAALRLRAARDPEGIVGHCLGALARIWHLLAIAYVIGVLLVWLARPTDSLGFVLGATLRSAGAVVLGTLAMVILSRRIAGGITLSDRLRGQLPLLEPRLNTFVPHMLSIVRLVLFFAVIAAILQAWSLFDALSWLTTGTGGPVARMLLSAATTLLVATLIWLAFASWIDFRLNPSGTRIATARERTLLALFRNAFTVVLVTMTVMLTLASLGVNIAPLLAGAGVVGLAIGFGAQTLVKDIITGAFIQFENAMNTGDVVTAGGVTGTVEKLTIRSVALRDSAGTYHLIPFSSVATVSNFNKDFSYHVADVVIGRQKDVAKVKTLMREAFDELRASPEGVGISGPFDMQGVSVFTDTTMTVRARIMTRPGRQWAVGRAYSERVTCKLDAANIEMIVPPDSAPPEPALAD